MDKCLLIFIRNPELGKVKKRLASSIGDENALLIYKKLLSHSFEVTKTVQADKHLWYTDKIQQDDIWNPKIYQKHVQPQGDLGFKMKYAFEFAFKKGYKNVVIIGSDLFDVDKSLIEKAFKLLKLYKIVIGPATDGGYYLLGLQDMNAAVFENKIWSSETVFKNTLNDIKSESVAILEYKNDIDYVEDLEEHPELLKLIKR
jgi:rSAM/selenodomain-associated transferase 1